MRRDTIIVPAGGAVKCALPPALLLETAGPRLTPSTLLSTALRGRRTTPGLGSCACPVPLAPSGRPSQAADELTLPLHYPQPLPQCADMLSLKSPTSLTPASRPLLLLNSPMVRPCRFLPLRQVLSLTRLCSRRHMEAGLAVVFMTDVLGAQQSMTLPQEIVDQCEAQGISPTGNAAGKMSLTDFAGAPSGPDTQEHITGWCVAPLRAPAGVSSAALTWLSLLATSPPASPQQDPEGQGRARRVCPDGDHRHDHGRLVCRWRTARRRRAQRGGPPRDGGKGCCGWRPAEAWLQGRHGQEGRRGRVGWRAETARRALLEVGARVPAGCLDWTVRWSGLVVDKQVALSIRAFRYHLRARKRKRESLVQGESEIERHRPEATPGPRLSDHSS